MRFTQDLSSNLNVVRGYSRGEIRINDQFHHESLILSAATIRVEPALKDMGDLTEEHLTYLMGLKPDVVLLGTGQRQTFPIAAFGARFLEAGIGFEVMDTGAACRTFNVLVGERRQVAAVLLL